MLLRELTLGRSNVYTILQGRRQHQIRGTLVLIRRLVPPLVEIACRVRLRVVLVKVLRRPAVKSPVLRLRLFERPTEGAALEAGLQVAISRDWRHEGSLVEVGV